MCSLVLVVLVMVSLYIIVPQSLLVIMLIIVFHVTLISWVGDTGVNQLNKFTREGLLVSLTQADVNTCKPCLLRKTIKKPFEKSMRAEFLLQWFYRDICGPILLLFSSELDRFQLWHLSLSC